MVTVIFSILFDEVILNVGNEKQGKQGKSYLGKKTKYFSIFHPSELRPSDQPITQSNV